MRIWTDTVHKSANKEPLMEESSRTIRCYTRRSAPVGCLRPRPAIQVSTKVKGRASVLSGTLVVSLGHLE